MEKKTSAWGGCKDGRVCTSEGAKQEGRRGSWAMFKKRWGHKSFVISKSGLRKEGGGTWEECEGVWVCNISSKCTAPVSTLSLSVYICCGRWSMEGFQNTGPMGTKASVQHTHINTHTELLIIESHYSRLTISLLIIYLSAATFAAQCCSCGGKHGNDGREEGDKEKSLKCFCNIVHCFIVLFVCRLKQVFLLNSRKKENYKHLSIATTVPGEDTMAMWAPQHLLYRPFNPPHVKIYNYNWVN